MSLPRLKVAVVGHTNTGKTSLLRTLTRDVEFGEVSTRPSTTRHVEGTSLLVAGVPLIELYDTPGLEDSIELLAHLEGLRCGRRVDGVDLVRQFLEGPLAHGQFSQEAKALRQVLESDMALYVIDARDRVLAKHRDELDILGRCARPVVPVLNFVASQEAKTRQWRGHLARVNMHAVAEFDTVVVDELGEERLYEKMCTLLDPFRETTLQALIENCKRSRARLKRAAADLLSELLIDVAAYALSVPANDAARTHHALESLKQAVRDREQVCVDDLLALFRFRLDDYRVDALPIVDGRWGLDLFNSESMKQFGIRAGGSAAAGAMAGVVIDVMVGGMTLGAAAAAGAIIGALLSTVQSYGKRLAGRVRGYTVLRVSDATIRLLTARQIYLVRALLRRGHASQERIRMNARAGEDKKNPLLLGPKLPAVLEKAKANPRWSRLSGRARLFTESDPGRLAAVDELAKKIEAAFSN